MRNSRCQTLIQRGQKVLSQGRVYIVNNVLDCGLKPDICGQPIHHGQVLKNTNHFLGKDYRLILTDDEKLSA